MYSTSLFRGNPRYQKLEFVEDGFIERNKINWIKGVSVEALDKDKKELTLSNGDVVSYDKVLLATGASTFFPPVKNLKEAKMFMAFVT